FLPAGVPLGDRCRPGSHQDVVARGSCAQEPVHRQDGFTAIVHLAKAVPGVVARNPRPAKDSPAERHLAIHRFRSCARQSALHGDEPPARGGQAARRHQPPAFPGPGGNSPSRELGERFWWEEKQSMVWRDFEMSDLKVVTDSTVPDSVAGDNYSELRAQLGDHISTFYGPHACADCGELIVKRAIEQGGEAFTFPKRPGDKYEPHICDPAARKADRIVTDVDPETH